MTHADPKAQHNVTENAQKPIPDWLLFTVGVLLVIQFAGLGIWQVSSGLEKKATRDALNDQGRIASFSTGMEVRSYQRLRATGRFDSGRQFLLDKIILNSRYGHYVLTPLDVGDGEPLLIVNRGWIEQTGSDIETQSIALPDSPVTVRGRVGSLPTLANRTKEITSPGTSWPRRAVYPTLDELAFALGRDVQPFVLLMDSDEDHGLLRHWVAEEMSAGRHFAYAAQWFAIAMAFAALLVWNFRRRGSPR